MEFMIVIQELMNTIAVSVNVHLNEKRHFSSFNPNYLQSTYSVLQNELQNL